VSRRGRFLLNASHCLQRLGLLIIFESFPEGSILIYIHVDDFDIGAVLYCGYMIVSSLDCVDQSCNCSCYRYRRRRAQNTVCSSHFVSRLQMLLKLKQNVDTFFRFKQFGVSRVVRRSKCQEESNDRVLSSLL
jgi:hypothetical protein